MLRTFLSKVISPHLPLIPNVWLKHSIPNHAGGYSIVESTFLLDLQKKKKKDTFAAQRSSAEFQEPLGVFMGAYLEQVPPPDSKHPSRPRNHALSTFVYPSCDKETS